MAERKLQRFARTAATLMLLTCVFMLGGLLDHGIRIPSQAPFHGGSSNISSSSTTSNSSFKLSFLSSLTQPTTCSNCSEEWLKSVARQSDESFVFEAVLRGKLQQPACTASRDAAPSLGSVLFVVMCSTDLPQQVADMMQGWMHWVPPENLILLCGGEIPGLNVTLLPRLAIDDAVDARFKQPSGKAAANLRDLRSIWWLVNVVPKVLHGHDWIFYVDDDTFVNLPLLLSFLHGIPTHLPLLISHIFHPPLSPAIYPQNISFPSGGGGMLFSKPALQQLGSLLFAPPCEVVEASNDLSIARCTKHANITKVDSISFLPEVAKLCERHSGRVDMGMVVTVHWVKLRAQIMEFTCLVSARFGWRHPQCTPR